MGSKRFWTTGIDIIDMIYAPYTLMNLSYVVIGAMFAPDVNWGNLCLLVFTWFIGVGFVAHALDELMGHPLGTDINDTRLKLIALIGGIFCLGMGIWGAIMINWTVILVCIFAIGCLLCYNLEIFPGAHTFDNQTWNDTFFMFSFAFVPQIVGYYAMTFAFPPVEVILLFIGMCGTAGVETTVNHYVKLNANDYREAYTAADKDLDYLQRAVWGTLWTVYFIASALFVMRLGQLLTITR